MWCYRPDSIFDLLIFSQGTKIILLVLFLAIVCIGNENTASLLLQVGGVHPGVKMVQGR